jgi:hypothetical protein
MHAALFVTICTLALVGFGIYCKITGMCSVLLCLHFEQPASGSEEEGSHLMQNTENICILCFVCSQSDVGHDLDQA